MNTAATHHHGDRTWSILCHLGGLGLFALPLGHLIIPAVIWFARRDTDPEVREHGRVSLNFQLTLTLIAFVLLVIIAIGGILMMISGFTIEGVDHLFSALGRVIGPFLIVAVAASALALMGLLNLVLIVVNTVRAYDGRAPEYWPVISFFKPESAPQVGLEDRSSQ